jgi:hypothetical protein
MPLHPGSSVYVPFSINNDQPNTAKHLKLSVLGFTGATRGGNLQRDRFSVTPSECTIGPMDFDRFVLDGKIPDDAPPDSYAGWVVVEGDEDMRIPVMLLVSAAVD